MGGILSKLVVQDGSFDEICLSFFSSFNGSHKCIICDPQLVPCECLHFILGLGPGFLYVYKLIEIFFLLYL